MWILGLALYFSNYANTYTLIVKALPWVSWKRRMIPTDVLLIIEEHRKRPGKGAATALSKVLSLKDILDYSCSNCIRKLATKIETGITCFAHYSLLFSRRAIYFLFCLNTDWTNSCHDRNCQDSGSFCAKRRYSRLNPDMFVTHFISNC